ARGRGLRRAARPLAAPSRVDAERAGALRRGAARVQGAGPAPRASRVRRQPGRGGAGARRPSVEPDAHAARARASHCARDACGGVMRVRLIEPDLEQAASLREALVQAGISVDEDLEPDVLVVALPAADASPRQAPRAPIVLLLGRDCSDELDPWIV